MTGAEELSEYITFFFFLIFSIKNLSSERLLLIIICLQLNVNPRGPK